MMKRIKLHLHKYFFYDILAIGIFILITIVFIKFIHDSNINKQIEKDYSDYDNAIYQLYELKPSMFDFDENDIAVLKMDDLVKPVINEEGIYEIISQTMIRLTKDQDQCMGYIIVKRNNNKFDIDYSHICDMIDY